MEDKATVIITYYKLGDGRFLRWLSVEDNKTLWVKHDLNLSFINAKNKKCLVDDFNLCKKIIGNNIKVSRINGDSAI